MIDLGGELRQAREEKGISLAEAAESTRIKERYLQALETNDWVALPTPVQARGFLRNYAIFLGLDDDEVMAKFGKLTRAGTFSLPQAPSSEGAVRTTQEDGAVFRPRDIDIEGVAGIPVDILMGVALALVVVVVGFGVLQLLSSDSEGSLAPTDQAPALSPATVEATPAPTTGVETLSGDGTPAPATPTFDVGTGQVELALEATEHVWVRVTVDGVTVLEGILAPGAVQTWQGTQQIRLETGNGAGLRAVVNGQPLDSLGERGEAIVLAWGPAGPVTPAPTVAP